MQLLDGDGNLLDTTRTRRGGQYSFSGLDLDTYQINVVEPNGWVQTSADLGDIPVTRGVHITGLNVGYARTGSPIVVNPLGGHRPVWDTWSDHRRDHNTVTNELLTV